MKATKKKNAQKKGLACSETSFICGLMMKRWHILLLVPFLVFASCRRKGCTDPSAANYDVKATKESGDCTYRYGCTDTNAVNYDPTVQFSNGSCIFQGRAVLYLAEAIPCDTVTVAINNASSKRLTTVLNLTDVQCGQSGAANFTLDPGSYIYFVTSDSCNWDGSFSVESRECTSVPLIAP